MRSVGAVFTALCVCGLFTGTLEAQDKGLPGTLMRSSKVIGMDVRDPMNRKLGDIQEVVFDHEQGAIAYAVLSFGGFLGIGDKLFAVPWGALKPTADRKAFALDVPKERLEKAPGFDKKDWPDLSNREWATAIHTYYGVRPYWEVRGGVVAPADGLRTNGMRHEIRTMTGTVKSFEKRDPAILVVTTGAGEFIVELAPMTFLDEKQLTFSPNDAVTLKGYDTMRGNTMVFVVTEATGKDQRTVTLRNPDNSPAWAAAPKTGETQRATDITGAVTSVDSMDSPDGRLLRIQADGKERIIAVGPESYLQKNRYEFRPGETLTVRGYEVDRDGQRIFLATEVKKGDNTWKFRREDGTPLWK